MSRCNKVDEQIEPSMAGGCQLVRSLLWAALGLALYPRDTMKDSGPGQA